MIILGVNMTTSDNVVDEDIYPPMVESLSTELIEAKAKADMWEALARKHCDKAHNLKVINDDLRAKIAIMEEIIEDKNKEMKWVFR